MGRVSLLASPSLQIWATGGLFSWTVVLQVVQQVFVTSLAAHERLLVLQILVRSTERAQRIRLGELVVGQVELGRVLSGHAGDEVRLLEGRDHETRHLD